MMDGDETPGWDELRESRPLKLRLPHSPTEAVLHLMDRLKSTVSVLRWSSVAPSSRGSSSGSERVWTPLVGPQLGL
jgi:hypothetical protein